MNVEQKVQKILQRQILTLANQFSSISTKKSITECHLPDPIKPNNSTSVIISENVELKKLQNLNTN